MLNREILPRIFSNKTLWPSFFNGKLKAFPTIEVKSQAEEKRLRNDAILLVLLNIKNKLCGAREEQSWQDRDYPQYARELDLLIESFQGKFLPKNLHAQLKIDVSSYKQRSFPPSFHLLLNEISQDLQNLNNYLVQREIYCSLSESAQESKKDNSTNSDNNAENSSVFDANILPIISMYLAIGNARPSETKEEENTSRTIPSPGTR